MKKDHTPIDDLDRSAAKLRRRNKITTFLCWVCLGLSIVYLGAVVTGLVLGLERQPTKITIYLEDVKK